MNTRPDSIQSLPSGIRLLERGWLSSNNVLLCDAHQCVLVDSGYVTHGEQTLALVLAATRGRPLDILINTHLHSDHCGGNALLQRTFPQLTTHIAPGEASYVMPWCTEKLSHEGTGQQCEPFTYDGLIAPGMSMDLAGREWQVIAAPGHDPHAVMLWNPDDSVLISADALWGNGFGIVFPELVGEDAFKDVKATLDHIEDLRPRWVLPGHGGVIGDVDVALSKARSRLEQFQRNPSAHTHHAIKALLKFLLLDRRQMHWDEVRTWIHQSPLMSTALGLGTMRGYAVIDDQAAHRWQASTENEAWLATAIEQLTQAGVVAGDGTRIWDL